MSGKKLMTIPVPFHGCPVCSHQQFIVRELQINTYLTGRDGDIVDSYENAHTCHGICIRCGKEVDMYPTKDGFIPLTPVRKILLDWTNDDSFVDYLGNLANPMEVTNAERVLE